MFGPWFYILLVFYIVIWIPPVIAAFRLKKPRYIFGIFLLVIPIIIILILGVIFPSYLTLCMAIIYFISGEFYETTGTFVSLHKAPMIKIEDFFHGLIPYKRKVRIPLIGEIPSKTVGDILMAVVVTPPVIASFFLGDHFFFLRRLLLLAGTTAFFRPITFCVTHMPDSSPDSRANQLDGVPHEDLTFMNAVKHTLTLLLKPTDFETSGDMIFSGHTRFIMVGLCAMSSLITDSNKAYTIPLFILLVILGLLGMYFFIVSRLHFSVDIILAVFVTSSIWYIITTCSDIALSHSVYEHQPVFIRLLVNFFTWFNQYYVCYKKQINSDHYSKYHLHYCTNP